MAEGNGRNGNAARKTMNSCTCAEGVLGTMACKVHKPEPATASELEQLAREAVEKLNTIDGTERRNAIKTLLDFGQKVQELTRKEGGK